MKFFNQETVTSYKLMLVLEPGFVIIGIKKATELPVAKLCNVLLFR